MKKGRLKLAVPHYKEALRLNPNSGEAHSGLGDALARQGKLDEAIKHYNEALRIDPRDAQARKARDAVLRLKPHG
jgi:Flp pilus assembly protein TadD